MLWVKIGVHIIFAQYVLGHTNLTTYQELPPLYKFDEYDDLVSSSNPSTYCLIFAEIQPDNDTKLWHIIRNYSNDIMHRFRYNYIFYGLRLDKCNTLLNGITIKPKNDFSGNEMSPTYKEVTDYYKRIYGRKNLGYGVIFAASVIALLVFLNITSTIYDYNLKCHNDSNNHQIPLDTGTQLLTSFSISRNFIKLIAEPSIDEYELKFTYFFRVFTIFFVIWGHTLLVTTASPLANPIFIENSLYRPEIIIFQNGTTLIQIFFVLTGFLMKLKFDKLQPVTSKSDFKTCSLVYIQIFFHRYLRILPSLAFLVFFNATLLKSFGDGPYWQHMVEGERKFCTTYWWKNIFMINNFMMEDSCAHQTWYLATDMQLYELYLIVLIVTSKFKYMRIPIYITLGILSILVPGVLTYVYRLDASTYLRPEYYRYLYFQNSPTLYIAYSPFYCNLGGYLMGFVCSEIYANSKKFLKIKSNLAKYINVQKIQIPFLMVLLLIGFGLLFSGLFVVNHKSEDPSLLVSLYAGFYRSIWNVFSSFVLLSMLMKFGGLAYNIAKCGIFRILGRLTFQMYLWHVPILRILFGYFRSPIYLNNTYVIGQILLAFNFSIIVAFILTIFLEYPMGNVVNVILRKAISTQSRDESNHSNEMK
ncbi:O-acyltransferase like protein isoform X2 [Haematobia irritans]|uniref:O-acyltransferase like protein isoform X2 n=1 Tax=Haematobia irritans TaxID=7368 RepID=UPI003F4F4B0C